MGHQVKNVCWVASWSFFSKEKSCFVCFCRLYVLLWHKRNFVSKQPGSTLSTTINGSRSCYITANKFAFLSVGTILARTIRISNNILIWFWTLSKNVHPLTKRQEKGICLIFERSIAHLAHRRAFQTLIITSAERLKSLFAQAKFTQTVCIWTTHVPFENNSAIVIPTIRGDCATHCNCSRKCQTCRQKEIDSCRDFWLRGNPSLTTVSAQSITSIFAW